MKAAIPNHRVGWWAPLEVPRPCSKPGSAQRGCSGLCPVKSWQQVPAEDTCPSAASGSSPLGPYPKAEGSGCESRADTPGAAQLWGQPRSSLPCSSSVLGPGQAETGGAQAAGFGRSPSCRLPAGPCMAAADCTLRPLGVGSGDAAAGRARRPAPAGEKPGSAEAGAGCGQTAEVGW